MFISQTTDFHFANYRFSFRKLQIFISQTTETHFANYRFSFRKLQILISQTTVSHFANYRFSFRKLQILISQTTDFHFVSSHFVSQTTVSLFYNGRKRFVGTSTDYNSSSTFHERNKTTAIYVIALAVEVMGFSYLAVPLYRLFCQVRNVLSCERVKRNGP